VEFADLSLGSQIGQSYLNYPAINGALSAEYRNVVRSAFGLWTAVTGVTFVESADAASNDIRIGQGYIDGDGPTLGEASYWFTGSTFLRAAISFDADAFAGTQEFYTVALHEIGHAIGLGHSSSPADVMYPSLGTQSRSGLSVDDMAGARVLYTNGITLQGTSVSDLLSGGDGDDLIYGRQGGDTINAGAGNNIVVGGLDSLDGADLLTAGFGNDLIYGNGGNDTISSTGGNDIVVGGFGHDVIMLGAGNDIIYGNQDDDVIDAGDGQNFVTGGRGNDIIQTGTGADVLWGNEGDDILTGGGDADRFLFDVASAADQIADFNILQGDRLDILGQNYSLSTAINGDALLVLSGGGSIQMNGITVAAFSGSFPI
jgi:hypothetical protein